ncbi:hypothetical protein M902_0912 [Bacteriovorax sp. BAL6_X]|uniref:hypothetical protein n=1 Tax=Bacteriovorax sp. BAL6_X TaxID=1201290 RepID=UPI00038626E5|nr:hypothetical protein [Bacteriovorax sp. BAL6_X]EPZ49982.1 hypothetical protein M902_0912 [Bacteriovorax sp. BAL6_X]
MSSEFRSLLRNIFGAGALAAVVSYFSFLAPESSTSPEDKMLSDSLDSQERFEGQEVDEYGRSKRRPSSFEEEISRQFPTRKRKNEASRVNVGGKVVRDPAYEAQQLEGSSYEENLGGGSGRGSISAGGSYAGPSNSGGDTGHSGGDSSGTNNFSSDSGGTSSTNSVASISNDDLGVKSGSSISTTDDSDDTDTSSSSSNGSGSSSDPVITPVTCSVDRAEGMYSATINVTITCSENSKISYCLQAGGGFCDPVSTPTIYSGPIAVGTVDGEFGLSYFAESLSTTSSTEVAELTYHIDSTPPDLMVTFPKVYAQTTFNSVSNYTQSADFGKSNYYYHQINFKGTNPGAGGLNWTCDQIYHDYNVSGFTSIASDVDVSGLDPATQQIDQLIGITDFVTGDNYIATVIEDRNLGIISCQVQNVVVRDFAIAAFTGTGKTSVISGVRTTYGGFVGYGHFQATPNTSNSGQLSNEQGITSNKQGLYTITHQ